MEITVLYFAGCPNWRLAEERVRAALADAGLGEVAIGLKDVETHQKAVRIGFRGSPTILVNGRDPFADESAPVGLSCRLYETGDGVQGAPTIAQLRGAIAA